jgi:hypothetical protein
MIVVLPISEGEIVNRRPALKFRLVGRLFQVDALFDTVCIKDSNGGVMVTKIFIGPDCDVFVVLVASIIVGSAGKGVSSIGSTQLVFQEDVVLFPFR